MEKTWQIQEETQLEEIVQHVLKEYSAYPKDRPYVLALHGDLGAGKTTFMQQLAVALGVATTVTSPTFVIMKQYQTPGATTLVHIDAYRIEDIDEMRVLGFETLLAKKDTMIGIEWAERIAALLPRDTAHLTFTPDGETRRVTFSFEA